MATGESSGSSASQVGKSALCRLLGWSRPKLDLRLETDAVFPVLQRGAQGGGWRFDPAAVLDYLQGDIGLEQGMPREPGHACDDAASAARQRPAVTHAGEHSARQRRDVVQAEILEEKLRRDRGELVLTKDVRHITTIMLTHIGKRLDQLGDDLCARFAAADAGGVAAIRSVINELQASARRDVGSFFEDRSP
ncbi:hypothetical protein [Paraburkholderia solisilvae]|uniref:Terminase small subunit n=1 Tax=Paraburkholderia solisilvae TaxID=624376 RepID=A0A6J5E2U4_9BURK|nr:hypothetical protein [Paraburkholderia solisilvae]CAB3759405.1 hypothetical protein LMG29739_03145 [Paraburkholderia solisilvae]